MTEFWTTAVNQTAEDIERQARRAEAAGFDGLFFTDSQNIRLECWVALTVAAMVTSRIKLGTSVTNPVTRHPAVTASAAATLQEIAKRPVILGVGRGDSSLAYLGYGPVPLARFAVYLERLQGYLRGEEVPFDPDDFPELPELSTLGYEKIPHASKIRWLPSTMPKVGVDIVGSGPKVIALAARLSDGVTFAVGADLQRLSSMLDIARSARKAAGLSVDTFSTAAVLNVFPHPDREVALQALSGPVAAMGRWSVMQSRGAATIPDERTRSEFLAARSAYDMTHHMESGTSHAAAVTTDLIERLAIFGTPDVCVERIRAVQELGFDRLHLPGHLSGDDPDHVLARTLMAKEVLPNLR